MTLEDLLNEALVGRKVRVGGSHEGVVKDVKWKVNWSEAGTPQGWIEVGFKRKRGVSMTMQYWEFEYLDGEGR